MIPLCKSYESLGAKLVAFFRLQEETRRKVCLSTAATSSTLSSSKTPQRWGCALEARLSSSVELLRQIVDIMDAERLVASSVSSITVRVESHDAIGLLGPLFLASLFNQSILNSTNLPPLSVDDACTTDGTTTHTTDGIVQHQEALLSPQDYAAAHQQQQAFFVSNATRLTIQALVQSTFKAIEAEGAAWQSEYVATPPTSLLNAALTHIPTLRSEVSKRRPTIAAAAAAAGNGFDNGHHFHAATSACASTFDAVEFLFLHKPTTQAYHQRQKSLADAPAYLPSLKSLCEILGFDDEDTTVVPQASGEAASASAVNAAEVTPDSAVSSEAASESFAFHVLNYIKFIRLIIELIGLERKLWLLLGQDETVSDAGTLFGCPLLASSRGEGVLPIHSSNTRPSAGNVKRKKGKEEGEDCESKSKANDKSPSHVVSTYDYGFDSLLPPTADEFSDSVSTASDDEQHYQRPETKVPVQSNTSTGIHADVGRTVAVSNFWLSRIVGAYYSGRCDRLRHVNGHCSSETTKLSTDPTPQAPPTELRKKPLCNKCCPLDPRRSLINTASLANDDQASRVEIDVDYIKKRISAHSRSDGYDGILEAAADLDFVYGQQLIVSRRPTVASHLSQTPLMWAVAPAMSESIIRALLFGVSDEVEGENGMASWESTCGTTTVPNGLSLLPDDHRRCRLLLRPDYLPLVSINDFNESKRTALMSSITRGLGRVAASIISHPLCDISNRRNGTGATAFSMAVEARQTAIVRAMLCASDLSREDEEEGEIEREVDEGNGESELREMAQSSAASSQPFSSIHSFLDFGADRRIVIKSAADNFGMLLRGHCADSSIAFPISVPTPPPVAGSLSSSLSGNGQNEGSALLRAILGRNARAATAGNSVARIGGQERAGCLSRQHHTVRSSPAALASVDGLLISHGAAIDGQGIFGRTPLLRHVATHYSADLSMLQLYSDGGCDVAAVDAHGEGALDILIAQSARYGGCDVPVAAWLINNGCSVEGHWFDRRGLLLSLANGELSEDRQGGEQKEEKCSSQGESLFIAEARRMITFREKSMDVGPDTIEAYNAFCCEYASSKAPPNDESDASGGADSSFNHTNRPHDCAGDGSDGCPFVTPNDSFNTPLIAALLLGRARLARLFIEKGCDINAKAHYPPHFVERSLRRHIEAQQSIAEDETAVTIEEVQQKKKNPPITRPRHDALAIAESLRLTEIADLIRTHPSFRWRY